MKNQNYSVLLIEDDRVDQLALKRFIEQEGLNYDYEIVSSFREAKNILLSRQFDVVITDYFLGDGTAFDVFKYINDSSIIITTGTGDEEIAVKAMKSGAYDYIIKDPDRNYLTVLPVTVENAIKQKQGEENQKKLRLLESALLHSFDAVVVIEMQSADLRDSFIIYVNNAFTKMTGYTAKEIIGKTPQILFGPKTDPKSIKKIQTAYKENKPLTLEFINYRKDGSEFWVEMSMVPVTDESMNNVHWISVQRDITERKKAEEEIRRNKERLDIILQSMGDGVVVVDNEKNVLIINNKACELLGDLCQDREIRYLDETLVNCKDRGKELLKSMEQESFSNLELHVESPQPRVLLVTGSSFLDVDGHSVSKVLIFRDFTKEKEIEQMKNDFVSNVSHELRTPLASILGFSSTILKDRDMPPEIRDEFIEIIYKESTRLSQLIEDILSISRIESGTSIYEPKKMELAPVVQEIFKVFAKQAKEKGIKLNKKIARDLSPIYADPKAIKQVIVNLLGNAIKFTGENGTVTVSLYEKDNANVLEIQDTGIGIPEKDLSRIFDKFFRVHRPGEPIPGTGLGLSIVKEIVDYHKGTIEVFSKENEGTTFRLTFPNYQ